VRGPLSALHRSPWRPDKKWLAFLQNHRDVIAAFDFLTVPTVTVRVLHCFFVIDHERRKILHYNVTQHPAAIAGGLSGALSISLRDLGSGQEVRCQAHRILDGSRLGAETHERASALAEWAGGALDWKLPARDTDHVIALIEEHLRRILRDYVNYQP